MSDLRKFSRMKTKEEFSSGAFLQWITAAGLLLILSPLHSVQGADWAVLSASDIRRAMDKAQPGDVLIMADGTWNHQTISFSGNGKPGAPITLRAETPGQVVLTGETTLEATGEHLVIDGLHFRAGGLYKRRRGGDGPQSVMVIGPGAHIRLTNSMIDGYNPPDGSAEYSWVRLEGTHHEVDHNTFRNKTNRKPLLRLWRETAERHWHTIHHNHFSDRTRATGNGYETVQLGTGLNAEVAAEIVVANNLFERCDGEIEIISNKSSNNVFRGNVFKGNRGTLTLRNGHGNLVEGNVFLGHGIAGSGGVRITGRNNRITGNYFEGLAGKNARSALTVMTGTKIKDGKGGYNRVDGNHIAANVLVNNRSGIDIGFLTKRLQNGPAYPPIDTAIDNNVIVGNTMPLTLRRSVSGLRWQGNVISGGPPGKGYGIAGIRNAEPKMARDRNGFLRRQSLQTLGERSGPALANIAMEGFSKVSVGALWRRVPLLSQ